VALTYGLPVRSRCAAQPDEKSIASGGHTSSKLPHGKFLTVIMVGGYFMFADKAVGTPIDFANRFWAFRGTSGAPGDASGKERRSESGK